MKDLHFKLRQLQGKNYGAYRDLTRKPWRIGDFELFFLHVQGDPYAFPSRIQIRIPYQRLGIESAWVQKPWQKTAFCDFLLRRLSQSCETQSTSLGAGQGGKLFCVQPGQEILERNSCRLYEQNVQILMNVGLPADGRRIEADWAIEVLLQRLPEAVTEALYTLNFDVEALWNHQNILQVQLELREQLAANGLVAFLAEGSILPRSSGRSSLPLANAIPLQVPESLRVELKAAGKTWSGLGIREGITVIAGGAYQGKSTLLDALQAGIDNHVPGDGREGVVSLEHACRVRVEDGRRVRGTDISSLVHDLPGGVPTSHFSTSCASGSTSQASNLQEAVSLQSRCLLIDEDISAVNFLIRDQRMQLLVGSEQEPLIPLRHRIEEMRTTWNTSFLLVIGACGDYLDCADQVLLMENWQPVDATQRACQIAQENPQPQKQPALPPLTQAQHNWGEFIQPLLQGVKPKAQVERSVKIKVQWPRLRIGQIGAEVGRVNSMLCEEQWNAIAWEIRHWLQERQDFAGSLQQVCTQACENLDSLLTNPKAMALDLAAIRPQDLGAVFLRLEAVGES